mmetsp:Transcript_5948/g.13751  ORF Transcript_5948/g.13751 Transcript_5948/m.13751 type:complete len:642 (-) Transcript_5948:182-2107(-)
MTQAHALRLVESSLQSMDSDLLRSSDQLMEDMAKSKQANLSHHTHAPKQFKWPKKLSDIVLSTTEGPEQFTTTLLKNLKPAILVAVLSVSLSVGLGIASGSSPTAGLRTAVWGGIICGLFSSSPYNIVGPAGALSGQLSKYSAQYGSEILPWIAIGSGLLCAVMLKLGMQKYMLFMPKSVFEGFTVAVALVIGLKQINYALGLTGLEKHEQFVDSLWESITHLDRAEWGSMVVFFPQVIALYTLTKVCPKIPWMVIIPLSTIFLGFAAEQGGWWDLPMLKTEFGKLPNDIISLPQISVLPTILENFIGFVSACGSVCLVSVLETLISAKIADIRADNNELGNFNEAQELGALSVAQLVCGAFAGLPPTGVFVRASVNQLNGATHRIAQFMNAIIVMIITVATMPAFSYLPLPSVAALLVVSAVRMVPFHFLHELWQHDKKHLFICIFTAVVGFISDPVEGLLAGTLLAFLNLAMDEHEAPGGVVLELSESLSDDIDLTFLVIKFAGPINYANSDSMVRRGTRISELCNTEIHGAVIDMTYLTEIDLDGVEGIDRLCDTLVRRIKRKNRHAGYPHVRDPMILFASVPGHLRLDLERSHHYRGSVEQGSVLPSSSAAVKFANSIISAKHTGEEKIVGPGEDQV